MGRLEKRVEDIEVGRCPALVEETVAGRYEDFDHLTIRKNALRIGLLVAVLSWLGIGGWAGHGCYGCADGGNAAMGAFGFVLVGVAAAFFVGAAAAVAMAIVPCAKAAEDLDDTLDLYESVCWDEADLIPVSFVIAAIGLLLFIGVAAAAVLTLL
jgi:hypothetical protein